jgi:uncharacterized protein YegJ (DUF2314 family)
MTSTNNNLPITDTVSFLPSDTAMNSAIDSAKAHFNEFEKAISTLDPSDSVFRLKVRLPTPDGGGEHLWMTEIYKKGDNYFGVLSNRPALITSIALGDTLEIQKNQITDWTFKRSGRRIGGYTVQMVRSRL